MFLIFEMAVYGAVRYACVETLFGVWNRLVHVSCRES
jgi:hypothetical protein